MNVIANTSSIGGDVPDFLLNGELVVNNGRMKGARRTLVNPLTLIGQAAGCEVRLNVDGVRPLHCAIAQGPEGYILRDLTGECATVVNKQKVNVHLLKDGDQLAIGPFQFLVSIPDAIRPESYRRSSAALKSERDALRIQAAAVASQQAGLTEEEIRLEKRFLALQRQEEELSARLDERQGQLREQDIQLQRDQEAIQLERAELSKLRIETEEKAAEAAAERRRLEELRERFKQRWSRQWQGRKVQLDEGEKALKAAQSRLETENADLKHLQEKLTEARLHFTAEMEQGRLQLQEEWKELGLAQQQWEVTLNQEHADRDRRLHALGQRMEAVARAESELEKERQAWQQFRADIERDVSGLENRIRNQRQQLVVLERKMPRQGAASPVIPWSKKRAAVSKKLPMKPEDASGAPSDFPVEVKARPGIELSEAVRRVAALVADQRWHLLEQWERLLWVHDEWEKERVRALTEVEAVCQRLQQREQRLEERAVQVQQRQETLAHLRCSLEGWHARIQVRNIAWEAEREEVLSAVRAREEAVAAQLYLAEEQQKKRVARHTEQVQVLKSARDRYEEARKQYVSLWKTCEDRQKALLAEQQSLARQTLTLERFRAEYLGQANDAMMAEKRLDRLQRNCDGLNAEADQQRERERRVLQTEMARLEKRAVELAEMEKNLLERTEGLAVRVAELEKQQTTDSQSQARRKQEIEALQTHNRLAEMQVEKLREEVERMALLLLEEVDANLLPAATNSQAA